MTELNVYSFSLYLASCLALIEEAALLLSIRQCSVLLVAIHYNIMFTLRHDYRNVNGSFLSHSFAAA